MTDFAYLGSLPLLGRLVALGVVLRALGAAYSFRFSENSKTWALLQAKADARFLSTQVAGGFIGCLYGTSAG